MDLTYKIIAFVTKLLSYIIPIDNSLLVFHSTPNYGDNSYAVFKYLIKKYSNSYKYVWLIDGNFDANTILNDEHANISIKAIRRKSLRGVFYCYRARYIFNTIGIFVNICFRQKDKRINMWHGMPLKVITSETSNGDITIATSEIFVPLMADGLKIPMSNVLVIGQPRNDMLFHPELLPSKFKKIISNYRHIGIWMPTFRRSYIDKKYNDGVYRDGCIAFVKLEELQTINNLLAEYNTLLIIKLHPLDVLQLQHFPNYSNLIILKNDNFEQRYLYYLLANCSFLFSDVSSVIVDYEILRRPIGVVMDDFEMYKATRGINNVRIPGTHITCTKELTNFIANLATDQISVIDNKDYYNLYRDDKSTKRLIEFLGL